MMTRSGTKNISSSLSFLSWWTDLGAGGRLGCELGEGSDSYGGLVDIIHLLSH
jgi:hypothetical protein